MLGNALVIGVMKTKCHLKYVLFGRQICSPIYNTFVISLGGGISRDPKIPFSRFLFMVWVLASFVLRTIYQGLMYHFLRHDVHKSPPKTIDALLRENYTIFISEYIYNSVEHVKKLRERAVVLNTTELESFPMVNEPKKYGFEKLAILTTHEYFGYFRWFHRNNQGYYLVPEVLFTQQLSIYMMKDSIFLKRFNMYIKSFINEGLMHRWEKHLLTRNTFRKMSSDEQPKALGIYELYGAWNLWMICLAISFGVFVGEILVHYLGLWVKRRRRRLRKMQMKYQWID